MSKVKNRIIAYIKENLEHQDQYDNISNRLNLLNNKKEEKYYMNKPKVLKFALPCLLLIISLIIGIIFLGNSSGSVMEKDPVAVVQMDVNPSISFVIDEDGNVISVYGENDEGKMIINGEEIVGKKLEEAVEIIINLESQTGYLVKGKVETNENAISFSIEANTQEIANEIESKVNNCVNNICDKLKIDETLEIVKNNTKEILVKRAMEIDPSLTLEEASVMDNKQLLSYISGCQIEKINIPTEEIEQLYDRVKTQKIELVEKEQTQKIIEGLDDSYQVTKDNYQKLYQALIDAQKALNDAYVKYFIAEGCGYQKALEEFQSLKLEVIKLQNEIAQMEDSPNKKIQEGILKTKQALLEAALKALETTKELANIAVTAISDTITIALNNMDEFLNQLPTEIKTEVTDSLSNLEVEVNAVKDNMFAEFEKNYKAEIEAAYNNSKEYKENLISQLKTK